MSLYHWTFLLLLAGAAYEGIRRETPKWLLYGVFGLLCLMLGLRYGQGSDYFSYGHIYYELPTNLADAFRAEQIHGEWGWKTLCVLCRRLNMPYPAFVLLVSAAQMVLLWRFLQRFCRYRLLALLLCWHTLYLTYFFSIMRQGLAVAIFLGLMLEWLAEKRYIRYWIGCLVCASLHSSALVLAALPLLQKCRIRYLIWTAATAWAAGAVLATGVLNDLMARFLPGAVANYLAVEPVSLGAIGERLVTYGVVAVAYRQYLLREGPGNKTVFLLMGIVTAGMLLYGGLLWMPLVASRTAYILKTAEIALLSSILPERGRSRWLLLGFCGCLALGMHVKNIGSYISHAAYYEWVNVINYPYVPVFFKENILKYLQPPYDYLP